MKTPLMRRTVVLFGLVALAATCVHAQGFPVNNWPGGYGNNNPYNPNPTSNENGSSNNSADSGNSGNNDAGNGDGSGGGTSTGSGGGSSSNNNGNGNGANSGGGVFGGGGSGTTGGDGGFSPGFGPGLGFASNYFDISDIITYPVIHGALAATAFGFLFPLGAIVMRVVRGRTALFAHGIIQVLAYATYIAGAGLGLYLVSVIRIPTSGAGLLDIAGKNAHPIIGIVLIVALFFQPIFGFAHHSRFKKLKRRTWVSHVHLWIGRLGITLGIINGGLGFALAGTTGAPVIAYAVISAIMWVIWVLTALRGEYMRSRPPRRERRHEKVVQEDRGYMPAVRGGGPGSTRPPSEDGADPPREYHPPHDAAMDIPSPPYTEGPHYEVHMAYAQHQPAGRGMPNMKEVMDRSDTVSILSASQDEMNRGQV
ncbi:hypothetical protein F4824DRAFT_326606 [Ustulina deusta]|nr:hypothetical protein F4824DRAFT_326606 [Ustulina deusta]